MLSSGVCIGRFFGCVDSSMFNYDPHANTDDGRCVPDIRGCTHAAALNLLPAANVDDGSCGALGRPCMKDRTFARIRLHSPVY